MFSFSKFDEVFDFDPDCSYDTIAVQRIEGDRKTLEGLFVDILMKNAGIRRRMLSLTSTYILSADISLSCQILSSKDE
jgi:hypothetical protein